MFIIFFQQRPGGWGDAGGQWAGVKPKTPSTGSWGEGEWNAMPQAKKVFEGLVLKEKLNR